MSKTAKRKASSNQPAPGSKTAAVEKQSYLNLVKRLYRMGAAGIDELRESRNTARIKFAGHLATEDECVDFVVGSLKPRRTK